LNEGFSQVVVGKFMMGVACAGYKGSEVEVSGNVLWLRAADPREPSDQDTSLLLVPT
jgi:hypothetical protein